jgi:hypothetical protein
LEQDYAARRDSQLLKRIDLEKELDARTARLDQLSKKKQEL